MSTLKKLNVPIFFGEGRPWGLNETNYRLKIFGTGKPDILLTFDEIQKLPYKEIDSRMTSVSGFSVRGVWGGVLFSDLLAHFGLTESAERLGFIRLVSVTGYDTTVSHRDTTRPDAMIAYRIDGEPIELDYGGPVRAFFSHLWGYKSAKNLTGIELTDSQVEGFWEQRGYPNMAHLKTSTATLDCNSGQYRKISELLDELKE